MARYLESSTLSVYSDLSMLLAQQEASRGFGSLQGLFTEKSVRGRRYLYFQHTDPAGRQRQIYIGPSDSEVARSMRVAHESGRTEGATDLQTAISRLARQFHASGCPTADPAQFKVIARLADSGLFQAGCVLIGTHAFNALGPSLGVAWDGSGRTSDIDFVSSDTIAMALPDRPRLDVKSEIDALKMGFFPIPSLSLTGPSTSFKAGKTPIQIDFLTPETTGAGHRAVQIPSLGVHAETLLYLDYVLEGTSRLPLIGRSGAVLVNVPDPGRFAIHKLITSDVRSPAFRDKSVKDVQQAREMIEVLLDLHPAILTDAVHALASPGFAGCRPGYIKHLKGGLSRLEKTAPALVSDILGRLPLPDDPAHAVILGPRMGTE